MTLPPIQQLSKSLRPVPPPDPFINRTSELGSLSEWIQTGESNIIVVTGPPGIGKTALVARFAQDVQASGWVVLWVQRPFSPETNNKVTGMALSNVADASSQRVLIVLDDVDDVDRILATTPRNRKNRLVVVTRDRHLAALGQSISLTTLLEADAIALLGALAPSLTAEDLSRLAGRLQGNPLMVRLISDALRTQNLGVDQLLAMLDQRPLEDGAAESRENVGRRAAQLARSDYNQGITFMREGRYYEAVAALTRATSGLTAGLGPDDPDTLAAEVALGDSLRLSGRPAEALGVLQHLVRESMASLDSTDGRVTAARLSLAYAQRDVGQLSLARKTLLDVVTQLEITVGSEHPDTLSAMSSLAVVEFDLGQFNSAQARQERVLVTSEAAFGARNPQTIAALSNLAYMLATTGETDRALQLQLEVVDRSYSVLGPAHPDTLIALSNLASTYSAIGDMQRARAVEEQVLAGRQSVLGDEHPDTLAAMNNLAVTFLEMGDDHAAIELSQRVARAYRNQLRANPSAAPYLVNTLVLLAQARIRIGQEKRALAALNDAIDIYNNLSAEGKASADPRFPQVIASLLRGGGNQDKWMSRLHKIVPLS